MRSPLDINIYLSSDNDNAIFDSISELTKLARSGVKTPSGKSGYLEKIKSELDNCNTASPKNSKRSLCL